MLCAVSHVHSVQTSWPYPEGGRRWRLSNSGVLFVCARTASLLVARRKCRNKIGFCHEIATASHFVRGSFSWVLIGT